MYLKIAKSLFTNIANYKININMNEFNRALENLKNAKKAKDSAIDVFYNFGHKPLQMRRMKVAIWWYERKYKQLEALCYE